MAFCGIWIDDRCFELLARETSFGRQRRLDDAAVMALKGFAGRYARIHQRYDAAAALALGRDLFRWLDGDSGALRQLRDHAPRPFVFEVRGPRSPAAEEWALLRAPFELLADGQGFLAEDARLQFAPVRRLGSATKAPPLSDHRLGLTFMAASPRGRRELDYEAEETAILTAVTPERIDLVVEESGNPEELGARLADLEQMQALHLSCHGLNRWRPPDDPHAAPTPVLMMETAEGGDQPTTAADLIDALSASRPRLVFLSACLSAAAADQRAALGSPNAKRIEGGGMDAREEVAHSLATALIDAGLAAVLGWDGSVADRAATLFARALYADLGRRVDLARAVAAARRTLLLSRDDVLRHDWHLARLWLGPEGGGPVVGGARKRSLLPASHGHKVFLDAKVQVPVAAPEIFVGRRRQIQSALRVLRTSDYAGVLIHGMGRLGKSSLAMRLASRLQDRMAIAVLFGYYGAMSVIEALEPALKTVPAARDLLGARKAEVRENPEHLEALLTDLLSGPCAQAVDGKKPVLLIIDDLERILEADPAGGCHRVAAGEALVLAMVLRAFDPSFTGSRLLVTSRFPFVLDGLERKLHPIMLPPLSDAAQRKLQLRQTEVAREAKLGEAELAARAALLPRVRAVARGNPGLQDLIGQKLVLSREAPIARAEAALAEMEAWLTGGDLPEEPEVRAFLENLTLDALLDLAGPASCDLLQALTLFQVPVPQDTAEVIEEEVGGSVVRLRDLGLLDGFEDLVDPRAPALAVNGLVHARLDPLSDASEVNLAKLVVRPLFVAWGGDEWNRPPAANRELTRLALAAEDAGIIAACGNGAMRALEGSPAPVRAAFGQQALRILKHADIEAPWLLLSRAATAAAEAGEGEVADRLLEEGMDALKRRRAAGEAIEPFEAGLLLFEFANRLMTRGDLDEALRIREQEELPVYERLGDVREVAITKGTIADILHARGDLDEALRIRTEGELPVYERLGDVRSVAITKSKIADILHARGDLDEALRILTEEQLPILERLGEVREVAITKGQIADILQARGDLDEALRIRTEEQLPVYERLGAVRSVAITKGRIADILQVRGDLDEALRIRTEEELPVYERLGDVRSVAITKGKIADILLDRREFDEALRIRTEEQLPVYERLGDVRELAITKGTIADILHARGDLDEALRIRTEEELPVLERLRDLDGLAHLKFRIAQIRLQKGIERQEDLRAILDDLAESFAITRKLGLAEGIAAVGALLGQLLAQLDEHGEARMVLGEAQAAFVRLGQQEAAAEIGQLLGKLPGG